MMKILILGGSRLLGKSLIESAVTRQHEVTIFNRGKTSPILNHSIERVTGDRRTDLALLSKKKWDVIIDSSAYHADEFSISLEQLKSQSRYYVLISSVYAYKDYGTREHSESDEIKDDADEKSSCERLLLKSAFPSKLILRPGVMIGPGDHTGRVQYWIDSAGKDIPILAPGRSDREMQWIDVQDLTRWIISLIENEKTGIFNCAGPKIRFGDFIEACKRLKKSKADTVWLDSDFLNSQKIVDPESFPYWNQGRPDRVVSKKAQECGLSYRSLDESLLVAFKSGTKLKEFITDVQKCDLYAAWRIYGKTSH